jgi:hypothetical protein
LTTSARKKSTGARKKSTGIGKKARVLEKKTWVLEKKGRVLEKKARVLEKKYWCLKKKHGYSKKNDWCSKKKHRYWKFQQKRQKFEKGSYYFPLEALFEKVTHCRGFPEKFTKAELIGIINAVLEATLFSKTVLFFGETDNA